MERIQRQVKLARRRANLDVCVGLIDVILALDSAEDDKLYLSVTSSWKLLTGSDLKD